MNTIIKIHQYQHVSRCSQLDLCLNAKRFSRADLSSRHTNLLSKCYYNNVKSGLGVWLSRIIGPWELFPRNVSERPICKVFVPQNLPLYGITCSAVLRADKVEQSFKDVTWFYLPICYNHLIEYSLASVMTTCAAIKTCLCGTVSSNVLRVSSQQEVNICVSHLCSGKDVVRQDKMPSSSLYTIHSDLEWQCNLPFLVRKMVDVLVRGKLGDKSCKILRYYYHLL